MRDSLKEWCEATDISVEKIEYLAIKQMQMGKDPTLVFISADLNSILTKQFISRNGMIGNNTFTRQIIVIHTSAGPLNIRVLHKLRNFLMVGTQEDFDERVKHGFDSVFWSDQERAKADKDFENIVFGVEDESDSCDPIGSESDS